MSIDAKLFEHSATFEHTVTALLDSEAVYFAQLRVLVLEFLTPIRDSGLLTAKQVSEVFVNVEQLLQFSGQLLADLTTWADPDLGKKRPSFLPNVRTLLSQLAIFDEYFVNSNVGVMSCAKFSERDPNFRKFLAKHAQHGSLPELLEAPILRLCRYPALLNQLVKSAPTPAYADALAQLSDVLETWVEDHARQNRLDAIGYEQLTRVSARIDGLEAAVPGRTFIHEGDAIMKLHLKDTQPKQV